jgi:fumarate hydratase class II
VIPEMVLMVCAQIIGNDATVAWSGAAGNFELNAMIPVIAFNVLQSIDLLAHASVLFAERCVAGLEADAARCAALVEQSLALATALVPRIGYDAAAKIARLSATTGRTVREICLEQNLLPGDELERLLDPRAMTAPGGAGPA